MRWSRVSARKPSARPARASAVSISDPPASTSAMVSTTVISSRSTVTAGGSTFHSSGSRPENQPRDPLPLLLCNHVIIITQQRKGSR